MQTERRLRRAALALAGVALALTMVPAALAGDSADAVDLQGNRRAKLADNEGFQTAFPKAGNPMPVYPEELLDQRLGPQYVCLNVDVSKTGAVSATIPSFGSPGCPTREAAPDARFIQSAMSTLRGWHFEPAFRCVFGKHQTPHPQCLDEYEEEIPQAVRLAFRVVYENGNGRPRVRVEK